MLAIYLLLLLLLLHQCISIYYNNDDVDHIDDGDDDDDEDDYEDDDDGDDDDDITTRLTFQSLHTYPDKCYHASLPEKLKAVFPAPWHSLHPALHGTVLPARCPLFPPEIPLPDGEEEAPVYSSVLPNYPLATTTTTTTEAEAVDSTTSDLMAAAAQLKAMLGRWGG